MQWEIVGGDLWSVQLDKLGVGDGEFWGNVLEVLELNYYFYDRGDQFYKDI